ncbi:LPS export ABC transporter permease LptF [Lichenicola cladoniae]|uniref:Lipopolysaccharide export system permease protein LptF n=1 Tax=Lichenicola cladoniae TaxID=1484109 RepID=A0A6M8HHJ4_9PROT|nr:LPS export ABC transporter permease LptF [Lichenicola cladoniae]NPD65201.1 LPS export ABC transporter permease LptF [Acetobacteraceae bacterium]QKE88799.1 LPS export ABC transporter permease LptF [Lichenicola cladoniae]
MIIHRYLVRELRNPLAVTLCILIALFASYTAAGFLSDAVNGLLPAGAIAELIGLKLLISLEVLIPAALYISVLFCLARLHGDSELAAMAALRVTQATVVRAVLTLSGSLAIVVAVLSLVVRPFAYERLHALSDRAATLLDLGAMEAGSFYVGKQGARVIFLGHRQPRGSSARDVFVKLRHSDRTEIIYAHLADELAQKTLVSGTEVYLTDAHIYELDYNDGRPDQVVQAKGLVVSPDGHAARAPGYSAVAATSAHLFNSRSDEDVAELQWRLSTPLSTLLLGLVAIPLSRSGPRQAKYSLYLNALLIYFTYYLLCTSARTWVQHGIIGRVPGIWWAPAILALFVIVTIGWSRFRMAFGRATA